MYIVKEQMIEKRKQAGGKREVVERVFSGADRTSLVTGRMKKLYEDSRMNRLRKKAFSWQTGRKSKIGV